MILGAERLPASVDHDPFRINRARHNRRSRQGEDSTRLMETGIFDPGPITRVQDGHRTNQHGLLHSRYDKNLVGMTMRSSKITQVGRDRFAQIGVPAIGAVAQQVRSFFRQHLRAKTFPDRDRKFIHGRNARLEQHPGRGRSRAKIELRSYPLDPESGSRDRRGASPALPAVTISPCRHSRKRRAAGPPQTCRNRFW